MNLEIRGRVITNDKPRTSQNSQGTVEDRGQAQDEKDQRDPHHKGVVGLVILSVDEEGEQVESDDGASSWVTVSREGGVRRSSGSEEHLKYQE